MSEEKKGGEKLMILKNFCLFTGSLHRVDVRRNLLRRDGTERAHPRCLAGPSSSASLGLTDRFHSKRRRSCTKTLGIDFRTHRFDETKPCETELVLAHIPDS